MTRTIAIDTSHTAGTVAARRGATVATRPLGPGGEHAKRIAAALDEVTSELGWRLVDTEVVVVVRGPGSFTGLRVGVATAKSIAWTAGARLVGVCGFEILARAAAGHANHATGPIHLAFDAGRGEVYSATASGNGSDYCIGPASLKMSEAWLASLPAEALVSGPAMIEFAERLAKAGHRIAPPEAWFPTALGALPIGLERVAANKHDDPNLLVPHYLRVSYAEESAPQAS